MSHTPQPNSGSSVPGPAPQTNHKQPLRLTGQVLEKHYLMGRMIARGGMSEVYYASDLWSNNPVAIKVLTPELAEQAENRQKFHREESSLRKIGGGHTVGVLSSGTEYLQGQRIMYIALEYVYGCTLSQLLRSRQALSMGEGLEILLPVVEGLSEVHAHRYVHLDMKPGNILLDTQRRIKLADFGLTRRNDQYDSGVLMGTPAYVAPEILDPQGRVGAPADIFALGVMMYRIFSGRLPFTGLHNDQQVLYHNANIEMPPITEVAPGIDPDIAGIIRWCTRKQADARPEDATELFTALSEIAQRMNPKDRAWRSPHLEPSELALWDEVGDIAERSGMAQMVRDTPISAYGSAVDLILDVDAENSVIDDFGVPLSPAVHEQGHIGIGPEPHGPNESLISPPSSTPSAPANLHNALQPEPSPVPRSESPSTQHVPQQEKSMSKEQLDNESFSAYADPQRIYDRRNSSVPVQANQEQNSSLDSKQSWDSQAQERERRHILDPRFPTESLAEPPSATAWSLAALVVVVLFMAAGFTGWMLATSVLQAAWWQDFSKLFGGL